MVCDWTLWQFDNAVNFVGAVIENALLERDKLGDEWRPRYTLHQLLDDEFRLPRPLSPKAQKRAVGQRLKALFGAGALGRPKPGKAGAASKPMIPESLMKQIRARGWTV